MLAAFLRDIQRIAEEILYGIGELEKTLRVDPAQTTGLKDGSLAIAIMVISLSHAVSLGVDIKGPRARMAQEHPVS